MPGYHINTTMPQQYVIDGSFDDGLTVFHVSSSNMTVSIWIELVPQGTQLFPHVFTNEEWALFDWREFVHENSTPEIASDDVVFIPRPSTEFLFHTEQGEGPQQLGGVRVLRDTRPRSPTSLGTVRVLRDQRAAHHIGTVRVNADNRSEDVASFTFGPANESLGKVRVNKDVRPETVAEFTFGPANESLGFVRIDKNVISQTVAEFVFGNANQSLGLINVLKDITTQLVAEFNFGNAHHALGIVRVTKDLTPQLVAEFTFGGSSQLLGVVTSKWHWPATRCCPC